MTEDELEKHEAKMLTWAHEDCACQKCQEYWDAYLDWWKDYKITAYEELDCSPRK